MQNPQVVRNRVHRTCVLVNICVDNVRKLPKTMRSDGTPLLISSSIIDLTGIKKKKFLIDITSYMLRSKC